jgi:hypothetical protein
LAKRIPNNYVIDEENKIVRIELRRRNKENMWTIIDLEDLDYVIKWTWYARYNRSNQKYYATHTVYSSEIKTTEASIGLQYYLMNKNNDPNIYIDHYNHDTLDNRKENLRVTSNDENTKHRDSKNVNNKSGYRNVAYIKGDHKHPYYVQLMVNGRNTVLGKFSDVDEAGAYAKRMRHELYGEFAGED